MYGIQQHEVLIDLNGIRFNARPVAFIMVAISDSFKLIRIPLEKEPDVKRFLKHILESCNLSTENVEKIKIRKMSASAKFNTDRNVYSRPDGSIYESYDEYARTINRAKLDKTLKCVESCTRSIIALAGI